MVKAERPTALAVAPRINRGMVSVIRRCRCASPDTICRRRSGLFRAQFQPAVHAECGDDPARNGFAAGDAPAHPASAPRCHLAFQLRICLSGVDLKGNPRSRASPTVVMRFFPVWQGSFGA